MLRATAPVQKLASTHGGMRRILKKRLPVQKYIELAVKAGSYKSPSTRPNYLGLHDLPEIKGYMTPREREERLKLQRGIIDYPTEYEILSLNPPLPEPPRTPVRVRKRIIADKRRRLEKIKKERRRKGLADDEPVELPTMDRLVKSYLRRHEDKMSGGASPSESKREEEYYNNLLLGSHDLGDVERQKEKFLSPSSLQTHMGRKSMLVENAYAFALKQQQVMMGREAKDMSEVMSERESVERVEELLRKDMRDGRREGHEAAGGIAEWRAGVEGDEGEKKEGADDGDDNTLPSILHERPRAIRALNIWSSRLASIPYSRWTIGASTALDHWIAREVLQMEENTWQQVLEGGGTDAYVEGVDALPGGETKRGLMDRMRDIVTVRGALFPETLGGTRASVGEITGDLDDNLLEEEDSNATEKSIDELLASLGELDDDDVSSWKYDDDEEEKKDEKESEEGGAASKDDERMAAITEELQVWRGRNDSSPYQSWDSDRKAEFDQWIDKYVAALYPNAEPGSIDKEATRTSLLSQSPVDAEKTKEFWSKVRTETEAEVFLRDYRSAAREKLDSTKEGDALRSELEAILSVSFERQLEKLVDMGTLRPLLDTYASTTERDSFLEKYSPIFLEGLETEHLVPDPDGAISLEDLSAEMRDELSREWTPGSLTSSSSGGEVRFAIKMVPYGTDEYGTSRSERARSLYRIWNEHKANRARFEEALYKKGFLGLKEDGKPRVRRKVKKTDDERKV